jgi:uncharacterized membrane protein
MRARATLLDHPIHQILIPIPLGLFITAVIFDLIALAVGAPELTIAAFWNLIGGVVSGLVAAVFGVIDWTVIPKRTRARAVGVLHGSANVLMIIGFAIAAWLRAGAVARAPGIAGLSVEIGAFVLAGLGGYLGGELINRHAIGVLDDAHPDRRKKTGKLPRRTTGSRMPSPARPTPG